AGAAVEALAEPSQEPLATARVDAEGRYRLLLGLGAADGLYAFTLRARHGSGPPGPPTRLSVVRRLRPPDPFSVIPPPAATPEPEVVLQVVAEPAIAVLVTVDVRADGHAARLEARKLAGDSALALHVPLARDRVNELAVTGRDPAGNATDPVRHAVVQDSTAPAPPEVVVPTAPVAAGEATLEGRAPDAVRVEVSTLPGRPAATALDTDGTFRLRVPLAQEGENRFELVAVDAVGHASQPVAVVVVRDTTAPALADLRVEGATREGEVWVVRSPDGSFTAAGRTEPGARVTAAGDGAGGSAQAGADGTFALLLGPLPGPEAVTIVLVATDAAGNASPPGSIVVRWAPPSPSG
ncbi:MAG TPA: Ig-like domain-containing protein, partial [Thermodesulfobacteriota bacterium]|nr:Ig-like domain-containing protein [Thermodesulfobacteriota bacterium]